MVHGAGGLDGQRSGLLGADHHLHHAVLQHLEAADRHAELLALLDVVQRGVTGALHRADGVGTQQGGGEVMCLVDGGLRGTGDAQQCIGTELHVVECDVGHAQAVHRAAGVQCHAGGLRVDQEQAGAASVCGRCGRRHDQPRGRRRAHHHALGTVEHPATALRRGRGGGRRQVVAAAGFQACKRQLDRAVDQARQPVIALRGAAAARQQPAAQAHGVEQRLHHQGLAAGFHRGHQVDRAATEAAIGLGQGDGGQTHLGKGRPHRIAGAVSRVEDGLALLEAVLLRQVFLQAVGQLLLLVAVVEVHAVSFRGRATPWR